MKKQVERLSTTIMKILKARGLESRLSEYRIFGHWEKAVGAVIARHAHPVAMHGKKLTLVVDSPPWMQQLSLLKPEIKEKVNRSIGKEVVKDIKLILGEVAAAKKSTVAPAAPAVLDQEERVAIERYAGEVHDPDIREAVRRVMEKDFLSRKKEQRG
jgi:predicted nucleic acid-binding Zn ribbon protein